MKWRLSLDEWKMVWGFLLLLIVGGLTSRIALGKVEEATSYGLPQMIAVLAVLVGQWGQWAFNAASMTEGKTKKETTAEGKDKKEEG